VSTSFGGGLRGTGVPLDLKNVNTDHSQSQIPAASKGMDRIRFAGEGGHACKPSSLSDNNARKIMKRTAPEKKDLPKRSRDRDVPPAWLLSGR
jgi:hypothetical protein